MNLIWGLGILFSTLSFSKNISYETYIKRTYKDCAVKAKNIFLTSNQVNEIKKELGHSSVASLVNYYNVKCSKRDFKLYLDTHIVRTLNETALFEVENNMIKNVVITSFMEPFEYKVPKSWIKQLNGKNINSELRISQDVDGLTGATLSSHALVKATKKILHYHKVALEE